jgi:hypothetical protein
MEEKENYGRRKTVAQKMHDLEERYPKEKFIWLTPKLDLASELPEHLDLMIQSRKFSEKPDDGDVFILEKAGEKWDPDVNKKVHDNGWLSLSKSSIMALGGDAGINFPKKRRLDDGTNPDIVSIEVTGGLVSLSGPIMMTKSKTVDLALEEEKFDLATRSFPPKGMYKGGSFVKWDQLSEAEHENHLVYTTKKKMLQLRTFVNEMAETKAQLRIVRDMLGIPPKFRPETIRDKGFAILRVIFAPHARTAQERLMILESTQKMFSSAFMLSPAPDHDSGPRREIPRELIDRPEVRMLPEYEPEPEEDDLPVDTSTILEAEVIDEKKAEEHTASQKPGKPITDNITFLELVGDLKKKLIDMMGNEVGTDEYYGILKLHGVEHCNEVIEKAAQRKLWKELSAKVDEIRAELKSGDAK